jgi:hypothetical protein
MFFIRGDHALLAQSKQHLARAREETERARLEDESKRKSKRQEQELGTSGANGAGATPNGKATSAAQTDTAVRTLHDQMARKIADGVVHTRSPHPAHRFDTPEALTLIRMPSSVFPMRGEPSLFPRTASQIAHDAYHLQHQAVRVEKDRERQRRRNDDLPGGITAVNNNPFGSSNLRLFTYGTERSVSQRDNAARTAAGPTFTARVLGLNTSTPPLLSRVAFPDVGINKKGFATVHAALLDIGVRSDVASRAIAGTGHHQVNAALRIVDRGHGILRSAQQASRIAA